MIFEIDTVYEKEIFINGTFEGKGGIRYGKFSEEFPSVRQKVLITDNTTETRVFYKSIGFTDAESKNLVAFISC